MNTNFLKPFFLVICVLFISKMKAETSEGYYIDKNNDTIYATFQTTPFSKMLYRATYMTLQQSVTVITKGGSEEDFTPLDILSFTIFVKDKKSNTIKDTLTFDSKTYKVFNRDVSEFLRRVVKGKANLYIYHYLNLNYGTNGGGMNTAPKQEEAYILEDANKKIKNITIEGNFKEDMVKIFADCPSVINKIENKTYTKKNCVEMVKEYNACSK